MNLSFIFPGQGSQSVGMGKDLYDNFASAKNLLDQASENLKINFKSLLFEKNDLLGISEYTQPAIVLNSLMAYNALVETAPNFKSSYLLGHSLGEFTALAVSGGFEHIATIGLVKLRGKLMQDDCGGINAGMMVVLGLDDESIIKICQEAQNENLKIYAANFNCDGQVVIAGIKQDLEKTVDNFKIAGAKRAMLLDMSVASHCPLLISAGDRLIPFIKQSISNRFNPVISNVTAKPYSTAAEAEDLLSQQLISPVLYKQSIKNIEQDTDCFVEFGAKVLAGLNKKITDKPTLSIIDMKSLEDTIKELEKL